MATARRAPRPQADKEADRATFSTLTDELTTARNDLRTALRALPAPASRTAAQRRDALVLRTLVLLVRAFLISVGKGTATDRDGTADV